MVTITRRKKRIALGIAVVADLVQMGLPLLFGEGALSPLADVLDGAVAIALLATLGFRWRTLLALGVELVPGVALFPSWTAMVATCPVADAIEPANGAERLAESATMK